VIPSRGGRIVDGVLQRVSVSVTRSSKGERKFDRLNMFAFLASFFASLPAYNLRPARKEIGKNYFLLTTTLPSVVIQSHPPLFSRSVKQVLLPTTTPYSFSVTAVKRHSYKDTEFRLNNYIFMGWSS
jgi:hypothetical protein